MAIQPEKIETNYYPTSQTSGTSGTPTTGSTTQGMSPDTTPASNTPNNPIPEGNIATIAGGSLLKSGYFASTNYSKGVAGFKIDSDGSVEFGSGYFRGDITGASGTFSGTITASAGSIGGFNIGADYLVDVANSFGLASTVTGGNDVRFWAGDTFANRATADLRIYEDGSIYGSNVTLTGAMNSTSGWIGSATALVYESQGINTGTTGWIRGGQTGYNTGTGYFLGYYSGQYVLSLGNGTTKYFTYDGTDLTVAGSIKSLSYLTAGENLTAGNSVQIGGDYKALISQDSYTTSASPTTNFGTTNPLTTGNGSSEQNIVIFSQVDTSNLPPDTNITSAILSFNVTSVSGTHNLSLWKVTSASWTEGTITHNNKPAKSGATFATLTVLTGATGIKTVDITTQVKNWQNGTDANYGWVLSSDNVGASINISSREDATNFPFVTITFASGKVYKASATISSATNRWLGFCFATTTAGQQAPIQINSNFVTSGLTTDTPYYQSNTRGVIATSAGTVSKKIGLSLSTTEILILNT